MHLCQILWLCYLTAKYCPTQCAVAFYILKQSGAGAKGQGAGDMAEESAGMKAWDFYAA